MGETTSLSSRARRWAPVAVIAALLVAAVSAWLLAHHAPPPDGLLQVNGRIEGDRITLAAKLAGRVVALGAREGDTVLAGQVLVRLDDRGLRARLDQVLAAQESLQAQIAAQEAALRVLRAETGLALASAHTRIDAARAELRRAEAVHAQDGRDHLRARDLSAQGFIGPQALERAGLAAAQSADQREAARAQLDQALQLQRDAALGPQRVRTREAELAISRARLKEARAAVAEVQSALDDMTLLAPAAGTITGRFVNAGEVVNAGTPLLELTDLARLYLKGYLPEPMVGRVSRGMPARIHVDAFADQPFAATLRYVAARAEFTPKEVQTVDERVRLVYEIRLYVDQDPQGRLNPGQPADGMIRWQPDAPWTAPR